MMLSFTLTDECYIRMTQGAGSQSECSVELLKNRTKLMKFQYLARGNESETTAVLLWLTGSAKDVALFDSVSVIQKVTTDVYGMHGCLSRVLLTMSVTN